MLRGGREGATFDDVVYGGVISDVGSLVKLGDGTLALTGASTFTGGTTVSGGTLRIGNGGTTGSIGGNVVNNGVLAFHRSNALTFTGAISARRYESFKRLSRLREQLAPPPGQRQRR